MSADDSLPIVVDAGSCTNKKIILYIFLATYRAGFAGDDAPRVVFENVVGHQHIGSDAKQNVKSSDIIYPVNRGIITDLDAMELVWQHSFHKLGIRPEERQILCSEALYNPTSQREKICAVMFEKFGFSGLRVELAPVLSMYVHGSMTGMMVECGDGITQVMPFYEGYPTLRKACIRLEYGGSDVTTKMLSTFNMNGILTHNKDAKDIVKDFKEKHAYCSLAYEQEMHDKNRSTATYTLPDNTELKCLREDIIGAEAMFSPSLIGLEYPGVAQAIYNSINMVRCGNCNTYASAIFHHAKKCLVGLKLAEVIR